MHSTEKKWGYTIYYSIANIIVFILLYCVTSLAVIYHTNLHWFIKLSILIVSLPVCAFLEYRCLMFLVNRVVKIFLPKSVKMQEKKDKELIQKVRKQGHW